MVFLLILLTLGAATITTERFATQEECERIGTEIITFHRITHKDSIYWKCVPVEPLK